MEADDKNRVIAETAGWQRAVVEVTLQPREDIFEESKLGAEGLCVGRGGRARWLGMS